MSHTRIGFYREEHPRIKLSEGFISPEDQISDGWTWIEKKTLDHKVRNIKKRLSACTPVRTSSRACLWLALLSWPLPMYVRIKVRELLYIKLTQSSLGAL